MFSCFICGKKLKEDGICKKCADKMADDDAYESGDR